jgi:hypothetical protein
VWAIDANENCLHYRVGQDADNPSGLGWQQINLKCSQITRRPTFDQISEDSPANQDNLPACRDSEYFLPGAKPAERPEFVEESIQEVSIYEDSIYETSAANTPAGEAEVRPAVEEERPGELVDMLVVEKLAFEDVTASLEQVGFEEFIGEIKERSSREERLWREERAESAVSASTSCSLDLAERLDESGCRESAERGSVEVRVAGLSGCAAGGFELEREARWFYKNTTLDEAKARLDDLKRSLVLRDLRLRNIRESESVDKVSVVYQNVSATRKSGLTASFLTFTNICL